MSLAWLWDPGLACPVTGHKGRALQCSSGPCDRQISHALGQLVVIELFSDCIASLGIPCASAFWPSLGIPCASAFWPSLGIHVLALSGQALAFHVIVLCG